MGSFSIQKNILEIYYHIEATFDQKIKQLRKNKKITTLGVSKLETPNHEPPTNWTHPTHKIHQNPTKKFGSEVRLRQGGERRRLRIEAVALDCARGRDYSLTSQFALAPPPTQRLEDNNIGPLYIDLWVLKPKMLGMGGNIQLSIED